MRVFVGFHDDDIVAHVHENVRAATRAPVGHALVKSDGVVGVCCADEVGDGALLCFVVANNLVVRVGIDEATVAVAFVGFVGPRITVRGDATWVYHIHHTVGLVFLAENASRCTGHVVRRLLCARSSIIVCACAAAAYYIYHTIGFVIRAENTDRLAGHVEHWPRSALSSVSVLPSAAA
jgi:hypothetical protein